MDISDDHLSQFYDALKNGDQKSVEQQKQEEAEYLKTLDPAAKRKFLLEKRKKAKEFKTLAKDPAALFNSPNALENIQKLLANNPNVDKKTILGVSRKVLEDQHGYKDKMNMIIDPEKCSQLAKDMVQNLDISK